MRSKLNDGIYELDEKVDVFALASLLKLFFRELAEPLIPTSFYNDCIRDAENSDA